jgi:pimeloyl-ACP methyl ester carboxylesterase
MVAAPRRRREDRSVNRLLSLLLMSLVALGGSAATAAPFKSDRISVEVKGKGPDVVLIPGLSSSPRVWDATVAAVPGYRYHLVRVAGFDGAAPGANATGPVVAPVAEEIARYIVEGRLKRPALVGHSLGGSWAMMVAAHHPELASKVMVVDMFPFMGAMFAGPTATPETLQPIAEQVRKGIASGTGDARKAAVEQTIAGMVKTEAARPAIVAQGLASDAAVSGEAMYELILLDLRPELPKIKVPMEVLYAVPPTAPVTPEQIDQYFKLSYAGAPQAVVKRIPDSYHFIMIDQPAVFQAELKAFLAR